MATNGIISFSFELKDGNNGIKTLTMQAKDLRAIMNANVTEAKKLNDSVINFAALATGISGVNDTLSSLKNIMCDLTNAYAAQVEAETKLAVNMRNTMDARDEDIQSIKDLCSAQQEIGVIGDEVQLAGAQEMATYLSQKDSLEKLIPAMNDMLAQQYGLNATQEAAAQIGTMLGKVMDGQTGALKRYGYSFNEAQEQILKFGTESEKASVLCDVITASVGGMNEELARTDVGKQKQLENTLGDIQEKLGELADGFMPFLTLAANASIAAGGVTKLIGVCGVLWTSIKSGIALSTMLKAKTIAVNTVIDATGLFSKKTAIGLEMMRVSATGSQKAMFGLQIALRGLLLATGVGAAFYALTLVISSFVKAADRASEKTQKLAEAERQAKRESERLNQLEETENTTRKNTNALLNINITKIKAFNGTKEEEKKLVNEMNETYGETMGYFRSLSEWYNALTKNSKAYCDQLVNEAKARKLADQISDLELEKEKITDTQKTASREKKKTPIFYPGSIGQVKEYKVTPSEYDQLETSKQRIDAEIKSKRSQMEAASGKINLPVVGSTARPTLGGSDAGSKDTKTRLQEIDSAIKINEEKWLEASETEKTAIRSLNQSLKEEKRQINISQAQLSRPIELKSIQDFNDEIAYQQKLLASTSDQAEIIEITKTIDTLGLRLEALSLPSELKSIDDYNKAIAYQQKLRSMAGKDNIAEHDEAIRKYKEEIEAIEHASHVPVDIDKISTYKQLQEEIAYYTDLLHNGTEEEKRFAAANLPALQKKEKAMELKNAEIGVVSDPSEVHSISDAEAAISLLEKKIQAAEAHEIDAFQKSKLAFEEKKKALQRGIEIPGMLHEAEEINRLTGREYKIKISGMGFDELTAKIRELQRMLDDTDHPVSDSQRKDIESLIAVYEQWRREGINTFDTYRRGWDGMKGIGSGIESLTETIEGNGNAWQKITGIVDGFLQVYDGIKSIVDIIDMLSIATTAHITKKTAEATAIGAASGAQAAEAVTAEAAAAAQIPVIAANKLATASYMELAAAAYFAAHAYIPFAGFGIASGFVTAATSMVEAIGVMPFAEGGIVSGPTLGLVGEYAGASTNPEVIAPLNKLRDLIGNDENGANGRVEFEIRGDRLYGLLRKYERNKNRT